jgi:hypothetical protein
MKARQATAKAAKTTKMMQARATKPRATRGERVPLRRIEDSLPTPAAALGRGSHFAKLFAKVGDGRYEARLVGGEWYDIGLAPEVDEELADRCLEEQEIVLVGALGDEVVLFGALRTKERKTDEVVVEAAKRVVLRAGKAKLELSESGKVRLAGDGITVDAAREVRIVTARVEIP